MGRLVRSLLSLFFVAAAALGWGRGTSDAEFVRVESFGEKAVRLGLATFPDVYNPLVYRMPGQESVQVVTIEYNPDTVLAADLYYPPSVSLRGLSGVSLPLIVFPTGFSAEWLAAYGQSGPRQSELLTGWAAQLSMQGTVVVVYDANTLVDDFDRLLSYLTTHEEDLGLDLSRIGIWATSGHGSFASMVLSHRLVAPALRAVMFVHADPRPAVLPDTDVAFYLIYSADGSSWETVGAAMTRRLELRDFEVITDTSTPYKGFSTQDDTPESVESVRNALGWMGERLDATPAHRE
jgi:hypothetical protein